MQLRTTQREVADDLVLALDGTADLAALPVIHAACQRLLRDVEPGTSIAIDIDGVVVLDDAALGLLLGAAATARSGGATLRIVCSDNRLRRRLASTRFDLAVDVVGSLSETVADRSPGLS